MTYTPGQLSKSKAKKTNSTNAGYKPGQITKAKTQSKERTTVNIDDLEQFKAEAAKRGLEVKEKKPSLFRRSLDILSRPLYSTANVVKDAVDGGDFKPLQSFARGISGQDKTTYSDILEKVGVQNKFVKGGLGFVLDVALDPTTYFGGSIVKGAGKVAGKAAKPLVNIAKKAAPESFTFLEAAGKNLKDAFGTAFVYGYGTSKGLADEVSMALNKIGIAKEGIIEGNVKAFGKNFTKNELEEAGKIMIKNRRVELELRTPKEKRPKIFNKGFEKEKYTFAFSQNPKVNELVGKFKQKAEELATKTNIPLDKAYKNYIPFLDETKFAAKPKTATAFTYPDSASPLEKSDEGYLKHFQDLIKDDDLLKKPIEAYSRREFQIVRDKTVTDTMQSLVKAYGKGFDEFKNLDEAVNAGYTAIKDKKFGKVIGYLKEQDGKFINDYLFPEYKAIDTLAKASGYDAFTTLFKTAVTSYFPSFHIRNYISGNVQNYQALGVRALAPSNINSAFAILKGSDTELKLGGKIFNAKELNKVMQERFGGSSRYISDIGDYIEELAGKNFKLKPVGKARQVGNFIEMNQKAVATVTALKQGKTLKEALNLAEMAGFDYSKITKFESKIMRRLIPFYTFARKNAELQLKTLVNHPDRIINQAKLANAFSVVFGGKTTEEDLQGLPDWVLGGLGFKIEGKKYLSSFGLPLEEHIARWNKPLMSTLSSLNPLIRYPLESKLGFDFFREDKIANIDNLAPATGELLMKAKENGTMPEWLDQLLNVESYVSPQDGKTKYTMSPKALHILRNLPTSRIENTFEKLFDGDLEKVNKWTAFLSGAKVYDIDFEQQQYFKEKDLRRDIEDQLLRRGIGERFESFYIRK